MTNDKWKHKRLYIYIYICVCVYKLVCFHLSFCIEIRNKDSAGPKIFGGSKVKYDKLVGYPSLISHDLFAVKI